MCTPVFLVLPQCPLRSRSNNVQKTQQYAAVVSSSPTQTSEPFNESRPTKSSTCTDGCADTPHRGLWILTNGRSVPPSVSLTAVPCGQPDYQAHRVFITSQEIGRPRTIARLSLLFRHVLNNSCTNVDEHCHTRRLPASAACQVMDQDTTKPVGSRESSSVLTAAVGLTRALSPVHTGNNLEATFYFVANGNDVERVYHKISSFRQCRNELSMFSLSRLCRKDEISFDVVASCQKRQNCCQKRRQCRSNIRLCRKNRSTCIAFDNVASTLLLVWTWLYVRRRPYHAVDGGRPRSNMCERGRRSRKSSIARFQYSILADVFRANNMRERRLHHYCCRYPFFKFLLLRN